MIKKSDNILHNDEEKLAYVMKTLNLVTKDVAKKLGVSSSLISQIKSNHEASNRLRNIHLYAICFAYDVPIKIFEDKSINSKDKINRTLNQKRKEISIFHHDNQILEKLMGTWYLYSYTSNLKLGEVWETKTIFYEDYRVEDEHKNRGTLYIGKNQSVVLKESNGSKNITSITFDNCRVFYNVFLFSRVSKSNSLNKEMFNFGICSKHKLDKNRIKEVLGDMNLVQLNMSYKLLERIATCIEMDN